MNPKKAPGRTDHLAQAAGGVLGVLAGTIIGSIAGPIGIVLGGLAGAISGWWSGRAIVEARRDNQGQIPPLG